MQTKLGEGGSYKLSNNQIFTVNSELLACTREGLIVVWSQSKRASKKILLRVFKERH